MGQKLLQKIVIVTRQTRMQALRKKYNTTSQAKFLVGRARMIDAVRLGQSDQSIRSAASEGEALFQSLEQEESTYDQAVLAVKQDVADLMPVQVLDRQNLPQYLFGPDDIVVTIGQDGLVANTAKYAVGLPIIAVNPDPASIDGILLPFQAREVRGTLLRVLSGRYTKRSITLAEAVLADGQKLLAFNDLFVGARTHVSARYRIEHAGQSENQSSSGLIVTTGAGSTGWFSSVCNLAGGMTRFLRPHAHTPPPIAQTPAPSPTLKLAWDDERLAFVVREPFVSKSSAAGIVADMLQPGEQLVVESRMEQNGVIFSDGVESDFLEFNAGSVVRIQASKSHATLVAK